MRPRQRRITVHANRPPSATVLGRHASWPSRGCTAQQRGQENFLHEDRMPAEPIHGAPCPERRGCNDRLRSSGEPSLSRTGGRSASACPAGNDGIRAAPAPRLLRHAAALRPAALRRVRAATGNAATVDAGNIVCAKMMRSSSQLNSISRSRHSASVDREPCLQRRPATAASRSGPSMPKAHVRRRRIRARAPSAGPARPATSAVPAAPALRCPASDFPVQRAARMGCAECRLRTVPRSAP